MKSCSSALCVLILLITTFTPGSESADPTVTVKLHESATLPCSGTCSGVVRWTEFHKPTEVLAECDQTECRSVKEGYQMIHDQYLNEDLSLTITDADLSKRSLYTCDCDGAELCDVRLQLEPVDTHLQIPPGEALLLKIDSSNPVEVTYMDTDGPSSGQTDPRTLCSVKGHLKRCYEGYEDRVSLTSVLELRGLTQSDSGVYTVRDRETKEVISIYRVTVDSTHSGQKDKRSDPGPAGPVRAAVLLAVLVGVLVCVIVGLVLKNLRQRREIQRVRNEIRMVPHINQEELERLSPRTLNQDLNGPGTADDHTPDLTTTTSYQL